MRAYLHQRPWIFIVIVQILFISWWITFVIWASKRAPQVIEVPTPTHVRS